MLHSLRHGLLGFTQSKFGPCYLVLSDGFKMRVSAVDSVIAPRFECFSLAIEADEIEIKPAVPFVSSVGETGILVLIREEYIEPYEGDTEGLVGSAPRTIQRAAVPGRVPAHALMSCEVAYGLLIEGTNSRLVVAADWSPFRIKATTDEEQTSIFLSESEALSAEDYVKRYGVPA